MWAARLCRSAAVAGSAGGRGLWVGRGAGVNAGGAATAAAAWGGSRRSIHTALASNAEPSGSTGGAGSASATTSPVRKRQADAQIDDTNAALFMVGFEHAVQEDGDEAMRKMYSLEHASNRQLVKAKIAQAIAEFGEKPGDTGSTSVQVAVLHAKITSLAEHCNSNRQDKHSRRGLEIMMEKRRKLLQYLKRKNFAKYNDVITRLKLRPVAGIR